MVLRLSRSTLRPLSMCMKGIVWLDRAEQQLARIFSGDVSDISAKVNPGSVGKRLISISLCQALLALNMVL
jgi:hypothetical protein